MDEYYWISEYSKVFCGYMFLMFVWPSVVFHKHLRTRSRTYRFGFCVTVPIVIMNTVVLGLGLLHGLSQWLIVLFFYGVFVLAFFKNFVAYLDNRYRRMMETEFPNVRSLMGKYRKLVIFLLFFVVCYKYVKRAVRFLSVDFVRKIKSCNWTKVRLRVKQRLWNFGRRISSLFWRYGILAIVVVYGMAYFSYGAFQIHSYGYGDLYIHHKWIYGLIEGNIFIEGVYPEAMHCFIYCMHTLFGIRIHSILLFLQGIHVAVFLVSAYLLLRRVFSWRYTPAFVLMLFLTLDLCNADLIHSMFRLQITMPMEFALHTVFLCALYLSEYLGAARTGAVECMSTREKARSHLGDGNLFLFTMSLSAAVMTHFHTAMMVFFVCASFVIFALKKIFTRQNLTALTASLFCAGMIAVLPMTGALAQGIPFSTSIDWAVSAISGEESRVSRNQGINTEDDGIVTKEADGEEEPQDIQKNEISITATVLRGVIEFYDKGYAALYGKGRGGWMLVLTAAVVVFCCLIRKRDKLKQFRAVCICYPPVITASVLYVLIYAAPMIGLPDLLPEGRFFSPGHMLLLAVMVMPVDVVFAAFGMLRFGKDLVLRILSLFVVVGIYGITVATGNFRGLLFYEVSRYNAASMVTESIINTFPDYSYTIVSPTDELYPVIQYGWHEELLSFVENVDQENYSIPSEYVFVFVEKKPLLYAQSHFFQGPWWMGEEKYLEPFWSVYSYKYPDSGASQSPDIITAQVSEEEATKEIPAYENAWLMYLKLQNRCLLESKAYEWCQQFAREHSSVLNVYYEDDAFVCYYFRQDMGSEPYELGVGEK